MNFVICPPHLLGVLCENYVVVFAYYPSHKFPGQLWSAASIVSVPVTRGLLSTIFLFGLVLPGTLGSFSFSGQALPAAHAVSTAAS